MIVVLLAVLQHLLILLGAHQRSNHLLVALSLEVDGHSKSSILHRDHVSQRLGAGDLVLLHPLLDDLLLPLLQNDLAELDGLDLVQTALLQNGADVGNERRLLAGRGGHLLQLANGVLVTNQVLGGLVGHVRSTLDVALLHHRRELVHENVVSTGQTQAAGQVQSQRRHLQTVHHKRHQVGLVQSNLDDSSLSRGKTDDATGGHLGGQEDGLGTDAGAEQQRSGHDIEHVHVSHLRHHIGESAIIVNLHAHGEVVRSLVREGELHWLHLETSSLSDLRRLELAVRLGSLLHDEGEQLALRSLVVHVDKASAVSSNHLRLLVVHRVQLDGASNAIFGTLANAHQHAPLLVGAHTVVDDLALGKVGMAIHHLPGVALSLNAPMEHGGLSHDSNGLGVDPAPEHDVVVIGKLERAHLRLRIQVEHLEGGSLSQCNHLRFRIHDCRLSAHRNARHLIIVGEIHHSQ